MTPRSVDPFSSPDEAKIATSSAPIGQDEYIYPLSDLSVIAWLRLVRTGEMLLEAGFFIGKLQAQAAATEMANYCGSVRTSWILLAALLHLTQGLQRNYFIDLCADESKTT